VARADLLRLGERRDDKEAAAETRAEHAGGEHSALGGVAVAHDLGAEVCAEKVQRHGCKADAAGGGGVALQQLPELVEREALVGGELEERVAVLGEILLGLVDKHEAEDCRVQEQRALD